MRREAETKPWDAADYIESPDDVVEFLRAALEEKDSAHLMNALGVVARSRGMAAIAARTALDREDLYRLLSTGEELGLTALVRILDAMELELDVRPKVKLEVAQ